MIVLVMFGFVFLCNHVFLTTHSYICVANEINPHLRAMYFGCDSSSLPNVTGYINRELWDSLNLMTQNTSPETAEMSKESEIFSEIIQPLPSRLMRVQGFFKQFGSEYISTYTQGRLVHAYIR